MPVNYLYWLEQIRIADRILVGDKAFHLGQLQQHRYPVIPGFVISTDAFQEFLEEIDWQVPMFVDLPHSSLHVDVDQPQQLRIVTQQIRQAILSSPVPDDWLSAIEIALQPWQTSALIFRPSLVLKGLDPTVSYKTIGLLESHLGGTHREAIAHGLKQTWAELFRARSFLYWQRLGIQLQQVNLAVLVQPIRTAIASGDVQAQGDGSLKIRATWGLGQALVRGEVVPDRYHIQAAGTFTHQLGSKLYTYAIDPVSSLVSSPTSSVVGYQRHVTEAAQQKQPALTDEQFQQLRDLVQQTTIHLKTALNLEWVLCQLPGQSQPQIELTQVVPQLTAAIHQAEKKPERIENSLPASDLDTSILQKQAAASSPDRAFLKGIPVSIGTMAAPAWVYQIGQPAAQIPSGVILVAPMINPDQVAGLRQIVGIITEQGGITSHGAILARELGIPAVVGVQGATQQICTGDPILINGDRGEVYLKAEHWELQKQASPLSRTLTRSVYPKIATQLFVTLSQPESIAQAASLPVDGVGLLRAELLLLDALENQGEALSERIACLVQQFAAVFAPRPVFYRSLDFRSPKSPSLTEISEPNPVLGVRGTFSYQLNPTVFSRELEALHQVQQNGYANVHLILPFVRTVEEFIFCRQWVEQAGLTQNPHFRLWIMAEVPSVLLLLPDYVQAGVQGIAIGINDLTQLLLGVDRDHPQMQPAFNQRHPAVMRTIQHLIQTAQQLGIPCSICGQAPNQPIETIEALVRWGITAISVDLSEVERVHQRSHGLKQGLTRIRRNEAR
ncbi:MAG: phosphoenolpyruvate synthase [Leptolyngbyaceae cyanobacterium CRU_2_3]|nr:phosphoenolpyruvate synthase [Leptolyngbyaceae cyanobacterium CRU_2_3]